MAVWITAVGLSLSLAEIGSAQPTGAFKAGSSRTVIVPRVGEDYFSTYDRLRAVGLRVTIPRPLGIGPEFDPVVGRTSPGSGARVPTGSVVTLIPGLAGLGSPALPNGPLPSAVVPNFVGKGAGVALAWADRHNLYFSATLPALIAGRAAHLLENYRVAAQRPAPGTRLTRGVGHFDARTQEGSFRPTPLTIKVVRRTPPRRRMPAGGA